MLSRDTVNFHLSYLATALRRKLDDRVIDIYHRECARTMDDEHFASAVQAVLDEDDKFPSIARLKAIGKGHRSRERGVAHIMGADREDLGPAQECLSALDAGRSYGGLDQFRGRPTVTPMIEWLVYQDAAVTVEALPGEGLSSRLKRIAACAEHEISRLMAAAGAPVGAGVRQQEP